MMDSPLKIDNILKDILAELKQLNANSQTWLTVSDLSVYIGIKLSTVYQYVHQNRIPYHKIPGSSKLVFAKAEVDEWIRNNGFSSKESINAKQLADNIWQDIQ